MRIGYGYDVHPLVAGRKLVLGGELVPYEKGLLGHSDADVLIHAACDAILGAAGLGDIGTHFPDTDSSLKDIQSSTLLIKTCEMIHEKGLLLLNLDATVMAEAPKLYPYRDAMRKNIALYTETNEENINIKFTTVEGLGIIGEGKGMAAACVVLIGQPNDTLKMNL